MSAPTGPAEVVATLYEAASAVARSLASLEDWGLAGTRSDQYRSDLVADEAALEVLLGAGFGVVSEESGAHEADRELVVVLDPVDGSTNAARGIPWWATSLCALDERGPLAAVVVNQASGATFEAVRGGGARLDGRLIYPSRCDRLDQAIVGLSGYPTRRLGWAQFRSLGAAALDLCAVACGQLDAFMDCAPHSLAPWDYLGGMLVCQEAGAVVGEAFGRDLVVTGHGERRTVVSAATTDLLEVALSARLSLGG